MYEHKYPHVRMYYASVSATNAAFAAWLVVLPMHLRRALLLYCTAVTHGLAAQHLCRRAKMLQSYLHEH
jgi:hypothetical protein